MQDISNGESCVWSSEDGELSVFPTLFLCEPQLLQNIKSIQWKFKNSRGGENTGTNLMKLSMARAGII